MNKPLLVALPLLAFSASQAFAQTRTISGNVTDRASGSGLPGVTVLLKGTTNGVSTNSDGTFTLTVPATGGTLVFSSVGFISVEQPIGTQNQVNIGLATDSRQLSEVVVVAYGAQNKELLTSSIATIDAKQFETQPVTGADQALQGRAAGVLVTQNSGTPGGGVSVRIRGNNSISGGSDPLYVVDGVPVTTGSFSNIGVGNQQLNALTDINPQDIASISVLKDAAAAALYGSRGANGVVLITTKQGTAGKTKVDFNYYTGIQQTTNKLDVLNGQQAQELINEARTNVGLVPRYVTTVANPALQTLFTDADTNWQDEIFRDARISNYTGTVSGGDAKTRFLLSGTFFDQEGIVIGSSFRRGSARLNLENKVTERVKVGMNMSGSRSLATRIQNDNNIYGIVSGALLLGSQTPVRTADGTFARDPFSSVENPVASASLPTFNSRNNRLIGNTYLEVEPIDNLRLRTSFGLDYLGLKEDFYIPSTLIQGQAANGQGISNFRTSASWLNETTLGYTKTLADAHTINAVVGYAYQRWTQEGIQATATNFAGNGILTLGSGAVKTEASSDQTFYNLQSGFARLEYDYKSKYIIQGSFRADGSSRFGSGNRVGYFPSGSVAWRISQEEFLKDNAILSELKIRGSYGVTGNFEIGNFASRGLFGSGGTANYLQTPGLAPTQLANPSLTWEENKMANIGINIGLLNNRFLIDADVFQNNSDKLLLNRQLPLSSGFASITDNIGALRNRGIELSLTSNNIVGDKFTWSTNFNISFIRNEVTELVDNQPFAAGFASWVAVGSPLGSFRGFRTDGIFQTQDEINTLNAAARLATGNPNAAYQVANTNAVNGTRPGDIRFKDLNGDGVITTADQEIMGSAQPDFFGGITNTFNFKGIDLSFLFQFSKGNEIYNNTRAFGEGMNGQFGQIARVLDRWTPTNTNTDVPRAAWNDPNNNRRTSDRWLEDGSYARLKTITLGYNLPASVANAARLRSARIYLAGQNLLTFTDYSGLDPEVNTFSGTNTALGTDFLTFPQARVYQVGVNLGF
ncbi:SusC/RagA family TonB-linked outer membrane protein [Hymenobacter lapidiphilus]|uniref:TonB-dependent receptor n=1 Tax=Hymenobacter lapidiphilus TaxID=2608003 RepID=A0A7Y7PMF2_9BACT|nr:TonB-dependent receptor [Hymenobacter lapidiphilus]NVO30520.1 TonB-dependent receptor [Hymenobacter lapidiphilus]